ncbi:helix-turn-helix domain-containing protein [Kribbella sp. NPDC051620]|uniref:helix-turn-helix domain-containing protein n=1 Tax=Kribbella sp. NPDC051620 TaxID=3364120 RepID=UPI0037A99F7F
MTTTESDAAQEKTWLTVEETAELMGVSAMTLYRVINAGSFPAVRIGRRICVPAQAIAELATAALRTGATVDTADWRSVLMTG